MKRDLMHEGGFAEASQRAARSTDRGGESRTSEAALLQRLWTAMLQARLLDDKLISLARQGRTGVYTPCRG